MSEELDSKTKLEIYKVVLTRYKDLINEKESQSISEIRQKMVPYTDTIRKIRDNLTSEIIGYTYDRDFLAAAQRAMAYVRQIKTCEFAFTFFMDFAQMDELKVGTVMDKAMLFATILRALGSENACVLVTKKDKSYVKFTFEKEYIFVPETGSLLLGEDAMNLFAEDKVSYSFNDLVYENLDDL